MTTTLGRTSVRYLLLGSATADAGDLLARSVEERGVGTTVGAAIDGNPNASAGKREAGRKPKLRVIDGK